MARTLMKCPECGRTITQRQDNGGVKIRVKCLIFETDMRKGGSVAFGICPGCKHQVRLPVVIAAPKVIKKNVDISQERSD